MLIMCQALMGFRQQFLQAGRGLPLELTDTHNPPQKTKLAFLGLRHCIFSRIHCTDPADLFIWRVLPVTRHQLQTSLKLKVTQKWF